MPYREPNSVIPVPVAMAGLTAGALMALVAMGLEAASGGSFWGPTTYVAALIFRPLQTGPTPSFLLDPVLAGLVMQLVASVLLAGPFQHLARRLPNSTLVIAGTAYGALVFVLVSVLILPTFNPAMLRLNGAILGITHIAWGAILGRLLQNAGWGRPDPRSVKTAAQAQARGG